MFSNNTRGTLQPVKTPRGNSHHFTTPASLQLRNCQLKTYLVNFNFIFYRLFIAFSSLMSTRRLVSIVLTTRIYLI